MNELRADRWLARVRTGVAVPASRVAIVDTPGGEEALVAFDVRPASVLGFDIVGDRAMRLAAAYYRARRGGRADALLSAYLGGAWGLLLDARWARWFGAGHGLVVRRRPDGG